MPVRFLTAEQRSRYGHYAAPPTPEELTQFFHLSDTDLALIANRRGSHNRIELALQLTTVRFLGTFLEDPLAVPDSVLRSVARQLNIADLNGLDAYRVGEQRWDHAAEIRTCYGYRDFTDRQAGFRLTRWLYAVCWTGTERPGILSTGCSRTRFCCPGSAYSNASWPKCATESKNACSG
ncbi:MAG: DUF4158 domain-containing protein [Gammaproteobacteria bacterium]